MLLNEDYPHAVPRRAWLRWRENWLYFLLDPSRNVFATAHVSLQPTFGIARYTCNLVIDGERFSHSAEVAWPEQRVNAPSLQIGPLRMDFVAPQQTFAIHFDGPDHSLEMMLEATLPMFDYAACAEASPDEFSLSDSTSQGFGAFRHQNQSMRGTGLLRFKNGPRAGEDRHLSGTGYRDHSWGMRDDNHTIRHIWAWMSFAESTLHVTHVNSRHRPELWAREGYWGTPAGNLALRDSAVHFDGKSVDGLPASVRFEARDALGRPITVTADIAGAYARNRFMATRPDSTAYVMRHNFCRCEREDTGEEGIAMIEIGASEAPEEGVLSSGRI